MFPSRWCALPLALALLAPGCAEDTSTTSPLSRATVCSPSNCSGCCDKNGRCVEPTSTSACGAHGAVCATCGSRQSCSSGKCTDDDAGPATCNAGTCATGCCYQGVCLAGNLTSVCGSGGAACEPCQPGQQCQNGSCTNVACSSATCKGCCDASGTCQPGSGQTACGSAGGSCVSCAADQGCVNGSCQDSPKTCGPANCQGCCDSKGCLPGVQPSACGKSGAACTTCSGAETCVQGSCSSDCGPATCAGCCQNNVCMGGSAPVACGKAGLSCIACTGPQQCVNGVCNDVGACNPGNCSGCCAGSVCQAGSSDQQCGSGGSVCSPCAWYQACSAQQCAFDASSSWYVDLVEVVLDDAKSWDVLPDNVGPDVYVEATAGIYSHTTAVVEDSYEAAFNEYLFVVSAESLMTEIRLVIKDKDSVFDDIICDHTDFIYQSELESGEATILYSCEWVRAIKLRFY